MLLHHAVPILELCEVKALEAIFAIFAMWHSQEQAYGLKYHTALSMTPAVTKLFNMLISLGALPEGWKIARVSPVSKSSTCTDPTNIARFHYSLYSAIYWRDT